MKRVARWTAAVVVASAAGSAKCADFDATSVPAVEAPAVGLAQYPISGSVRADYFSASKRLDNRTNSNGITVQVKALPVLSAGLEGKFEARATDPRVGGERPRGQLLEAFVTAHLERADLRVGKQIVAWGRADGINPTDNLTPRDFTVMLPFEDDQRLGTTAAKLDYYLSESNSLTAFATPFFSPSLIPFPVSANLNLIVDKPQARLANTEVGVRLNHVGDGFDWSISAFKGLNQLPELQTGASATIHLHYPRITIVGADFARNFGRFGVRGELAYGRPEGNAEGTFGKKKPYVYWVAGIDRTFFENLNVNLQYFQRRIASYEDVDVIAAPASRFLAIESAVINGQRDRISDGITFRVDDKWLNDSLEFEIFSVLNLTRRDRFIRPLLTYAFTDRWKGSIGAEIYSGASDTQFGSLKSARGAFAELRFNF